MPTPRKAAPRAKPRRVIGEVEKATIRDVGRLPTDLGDSSLAASAIALARELDSESSATSKSMCAKAHLEIMDRLRELAPPAEEKDDLDDLAARRAARRAAAGGAGG